MTRLLHLAALTLLASGLLASGAIAQTCTTSWTDASGGDWTDAANWDNGVPDGADDACIILDATYTVTVNGFSVNSLTLGTAGNTGVQTLVQTGLTFAVPAGGTIAASGVFEWRDGGIQLGTLTNRGLVRIDGPGTSRGVGPPAAGTTATFRNEGTVEHVDNGTFIVNAVTGADGRAENAGLWDVQADGDIQGFANGGSGTFVNEAAGTFRKSGGTDVTRFFSAPLTVENAGTFDAQSGEIRFDVPSSHTDGAVLTASGGALVNFTAGEVAFAGTVTGNPTGIVQLAVPFNAPSGATWDFDGTGMTWVNNGVLDEGMVTNAGLIRLVGPLENRGVGTVFAGVDVTFRNEGTIQHLDDGAFGINAVSGSSARVENAGLWDVQGGGDIQSFDNRVGVFANESAGVFRKSGGDLTQFRRAALMVENAGTFDAQSGTIQIEVPSTHTDGAVLTALTADGTLRIHGGPHQISGTVSGSPVGTVEANVNNSRDGLKAAPGGGALDFSGTGLQLVNGDLSAIDGPLVNLGLLRFTTSSNKGIATNSTVRNEGTVRWEGGDLFLTASDAGDTSRFENAGLFEVPVTAHNVQPFGSGTKWFINEASGEVRKTVAGTGFAFFAGMTVENAGTFDAQAGHILVQATTNHRDGSILTASTADGLLSLYGSRQTIGGTVSGNPVGTVTARSGNAPGGNDFFVDAGGATLNFGGTGFQYEFGSMVPNGASGPLVNQGLIRLTTDGDKGLAANGVFRNEGTVRWEDGNQFLSTTTPSDFSRFENAGLFEAPVTANNFLPFGSGTKVFVNLEGGEIRKTVPNTGFAFFAGVPVENAGLVNVQEGEIQVDGTFDHQDGALIQGEGIFRRTSATAFTHDGDTGPGTSPGILTWEGPYEPSSTASLVIEIAGAGGAGETDGHDQLEISGDATLAGALDLSLDGEPELSIGDSFVILTATSVSGEFDTISAPPGLNVSVTYNATNVVVTVSEPDPGNQDPVIASLTGDQTGDEGDTFTFMASASDPDTGDVLTYTYDFGDGSNPESGVDLTEVAHVYTEAGTYTLTLTVTDGNGGSDTETLEITVNDPDPGNQPPVITNLSGDTMGEEGDLFNFSASASDPDEGDALTYTYDFGDGSPTESGVDLTEITHVYEADGTYTLTLTVTDGNGGMDTETLEITVTDAPPPPNTPPTITSLTGDTQGEAGELFEFVASATDPDEGDDLTYTYDFGDGSEPESSVDLTEVDHVYNTAGTYTLSLTVTDGNGGMDTASLMVQVDEPTGGTPDVTITAAAVNPPVVIPASGGTFSYTVTLTNNEATPETVDAWLLATAPTGQIVRVRPSRTLTIQPGETIMVTLSRFVKPNAPAGTYALTARVGDESAGVVFDSDAFMIEKAASSSAVSLAGDSGVSAKLGADLQADLATLVTFGDDAFATPLPMPEVLAVFDARPNPFSGATTLAYELPEASPVRLAIYDARGREVAVLVDRTEAAGRYEAPFDASGLPSGVYLYRLVTDAGVATGRMTLVR